MIFYGYKIYILSQSLRIYWMYYAYGRRRKIFA